MGFRIIQDLNNNFSTFEKDGTKDNDLKETLHDDVFPHFRGDQVFEFTVGFSGKEFVCGRLGG